MRAGAYVAAMPQGMRSIGPFVGYLGVTPWPTLPPLKTAAALDAGADLETVLAAWHAVTVQLEQTHEALRDEVRRLTDELALKNRELARKNRLADLGRMASHVAHEVRNNLVPVTLYMSLLRRRLADDQGNLDILAKIEAGFTAMDATVRDLLHFTSDRDPRIEKFSLRTMVRDCLDSLAPAVGRAVDSGSRRYSAAPGDRGRPGDASPGAVESDPERAGRHARRRNPHGHFDGDHGRDRARGGRHGAGAVGRREATGV